MVADDQHRAGLGGKQRHRLSGLQPLEIGLGRDDMGTRSIGKEDAVWGAIEIRDRPLARRPAARVERHALMPVLDIEPDRHELVGIHAGVHRKGQCFPLGGERIGKCRKTTIGLAGPVFPEQSQIPLFRLQIPRHGADDIAGFLEGQPGTEVFDPARRDASGCRRISQCSRGEQPDECCERGRTDKSSKAEFQNTPDPSARL